MRIPSAAGIASLLYRTRAGYRGGCTRFTRAEGNLNSFKILMSSDRIWRASGDRVGFSEQIEMFERDYLVT